MVVASAALLLFSGCGTTTQQSATEQLLISDAVDSAISRIDFHHLAGSSVFLDSTYVRTVKSAGFVNADYIISSLRQQLSAAGCRIQEKRDEAEVIIEPRVGALGTNGHEVTFGVPQTQALSSATALFSGAPAPAPVPEISLGRTDAQTGIAKIVVFAYDRVSKTPVWQSGIAKAESDSKNTWWFGAGPFQKGSIYEGFRFAGQRIDQRKANASEEFASGVQYDRPYLFEDRRLAQPNSATQIATSPDDGSQVKQASGEE